MLGFLKSWWGGWRCGQGHHDWQERPTGKIRDGTRVFYGGAERERKCIRPDCDRVEREYSFMTRRWMTYNEMLDLVGCDKTVGVVNQQTGELVCGEDARKLAALDDLEGTEIDRKGH